MRARLGHQHHAALDVGRASIPRSKQADVVARHDRWSSSLRNISTPVHVVLLAWSPRPTISSSSPTLTDAALDAARDDRAATLDREHVLDRHQERLVDLAHRLGDERVARLHQACWIDARRTRSTRITLERLQRRAADDRGVVAQGSVLVEQLAQLHLDQTRGALRRPCRSCRTCSGRRPSPARST